METVIGDKATESLPRLDARSLSAVDERRQMKFLAKEVLDRIGYGLSSQQFLNILFVQMGASLFLVGLLNGAKVMLSLAISYFMERLHLTRQANRVALSAGGLLFGLSIFILVIALANKSMFLFIAAFLAGSMIAVLYGSLYQDWFREALSVRDRGFLLGRIGYYGVAITGLGMLAAAYLADRFTEGRRIAISALGYDIRLQGFMVALVLAAILFMFAALILLMVGERKPGQKRPLIIGKEVYKRLLGNRALFVLFLTSAIIGVVQTLATAYYGIYIFQAFNHTGWGGFMNVAIICLIALLTSVVGPVITGANSRSYGKFPMLVFGTLLLAIGPFTFYYNPNLISIAVAMFLLTIGSAIVGVAFGLLTLELVSEEIKDSYLQLSSVLTIIPYALFIPLGAWVAQVFGMATLFLILAMVLAFVVVPLYVLVIADYSRRSQKI